MAIDRSDYGQKKYSGLAIASFSLAAGVLPSVGVTWLLASLVYPIGRVLGQLLVLSFFAPIPLGLAAIVLGSIAIRKSKKRNLCGRWMAIGGIILGALAFLFFAFYLVYSLNFARGMSVG